MKSSTPSTTSSVEVCQAACTGDHHKTQSRMPSAAAKGVSSSLTNWTHSGSSAQSYAHTTRPLQLLPTLQSEETRGRVYPGDGAATRVAQVAATHTPLHINKTDASSATHNTKEHWMTPAAPATTKSDGHHFTRGTPHSPAASLPHTPDLSPAVPVSATTNMTDYGAELRWMLQGGGRLCDVTSHGLVVAQPHKNNSARADSGESAFSWSVSNARAVRRWQSSVVAEKRSYQRATRRHSDSDVGAGIHEAKIVSAPAENVSLLSAPCTAPNSPFQTPLQISASDPLLALMQATSCPPFESKVIANNFAAIHGPQCGDVQTPPLNVSSNSDETEETNPLNTFMRHQRRSTRGVMASSPSCDSENSRHTCAFREDVSVFGLSSVGTNNSAPTATSGARPQRTSQDSSDPNLPDTFHTTTTTTAAETPAEVSLDAGVCLSIVPPTVAAAVVTGDAIPPSWGPRAMVATVPTTAISATAGRAVVSKRHSLRAEPLVLVPLVHAGPTPSQPILSPSRNHTRTLPEDDDANPLGISVNDSDDLDKDELAEVDGVAAPRLCDFPVSPKRPFSERTCCPNSLLAHLITNGPSPLSVDALATNDIGDGDSSRGSSSQRTNTAVYMSDTVSAATLSSTQSLGATTVNISLFVDH